MKKRLLALALSLVLMTSLLPITAAAEDNPSIEEMRSWVKGIQDGGTYCKEASFTINSDYSVDFVGVDEGGVGITVPINPVAGQYKISGYSGKIMVLIGFKDVEQNLPIDIIINDDHTDNDGNHSCDVCNATVHTWQFTQTNSTLTATCQNQSCNKEVSASLVADSVTLPDSPFNAQVILKGMNAQEIKEEFDYTIGPICYKFKAPGDSNFTNITPADGAKEGTYQAAVTLTPWYPQASYALNDDGTTNRGPIVGNDGSITLYTEYTAVNPQTTAQTGDNRPIEIMMASVVVFSALAAAAFIVDNKRKYSR